MQASQRLRGAVEEAIAASLIVRDGRILSVHRVVQEAYFHVNKAEHASAFYAACRLIYDAFPKQVNGRPLHSQWERCEFFIHEAISLCRKWLDFKKNGEAGILAPPQFLQLLKNCAWYLFEIGDYGEVFPLLQVAYEMCGEDRTSLDYAHLRNSAGSAYFELNQLRDCRTAYEETLSIREKNLPQGDEELANIVNNMANLESAEGNHTKALALYEKARISRMDIGDDAQVALTLTLMGMGRTYENMGHYHEAAGLYDEAEGLIMRTTGPKSAFMAKSVYQPPRPLFNSNANYCGTS